MAGVLKFNIRLISRQQNEKVAEKIKFFSAIRHLPSDIRYQISDDR